MNLENPKLNFGFSRIKNISKPLYTMSNIDIATLSKDLLLKITNHIISEKEIDELKKCINEHDKNYYVQDNPMIADVEYDTLFKALKTIEEKNPAFITADSPTQRVAKGLNAAFKTVEHLVPMLSLENSYNEEDLLDWDRKCRELSEQETIEYCVEPKYDGASISIMYENDVMLRGATRGDGIQGDDITNNTKQIRNIPLTANFSMFGFQQVELRGEVVITKERFKQFNEKLIADNNSPLANPRNATSGALRMKDPKEVAKRNLEAFIYNVSYTSLQENKTYPTAFKTHFGILKQLAELGINSSCANAKTFTTIHEVINYVKAFEEKRDELPYEIDGMVIKVNELSLQDKIGQTSHHPRWAIAFKFKARQATSTLLQVEYQVGRTGSVTPVAKIEPVYVGGVTISSLSLFNEEVIKEKNLMIGDTVLIERAGDVIPYVVKSFPELRKGTEQEIIFPTTCPVCNEALTKPLEEAVWRCSNIICEAQVVEKIIHYTSKDAMDIRGLGDANIRKFFDQKLLTSIVGIYELPYEKIKTQDGFGEKSMEKLKEAIEQSKTQPLNRLLFALGIRYVGETTAKTLARSIGHISELYNKTIEELLQLEDVGIKVATSIVEFFKQEDNRKVIHDLEQHGISLSNMQKQNSMQGGLSGKSFLFTGTLTQCKRADAEAKVEEKGGSILGGVSSKLNYLVVGADAGSKLEKAKKLQTVNIITEEEFLKMVEEN
jgi:DNA ligase (NAD+)